MAYDLPKFAARVTVPAGGWTASVTDAGGTEIYTLAPGRYYPSDVLAALAGGLTGLGSLTATYDAEVDDTDQHATGRVTLSADGTFAITWGSAAFRDYLGFTGNLSAAASYTSTKAARAIYLPDRPIANPMVPDGHTGLLIANRTAVVSTSGHSEVLNYGGRRVNAWEFRGLTGRKTQQPLETYGNESLESFWESYLAAGAPFRYHWDRTDDVNYTPWRMVGPDAFPATPDIEGFVGGPGAEGAAMHWNVGRMDFVRFVE